MGFLKKILRQMLARYFYAGSHGNVILFSSTKITGWVSPTTQLSPVRSRLLEAKSNVVLTKQDNTQQTVVKNYYAQHHYKSMGGCSTYSKP